LDNDILQFLVSDDGKRIVQRKKKPIPPSASEMLSEVYRFASDAKHMVVAQVEAELNRLKIAAQPNKEWDEETIVVLKEEVLKIFYDVHGTATNQIKYHRDAIDGRQWISFFLKTVRAQEVPKVSTYSNDEGMADDDEVTADEIRQEMNDRLRRMDAESGERLRQMSDEMTRRTEDLLRRGQDDMLQNTQRMLEQFMQMNMANNPNQQQPQQPQQPRPDVPTS
jgi:hypothetical protein